MFKKKALSLMLTAVTMGSMLFAGCGGAATSDTDSNSDASREKAASSDTETTITIWHDGDESIMKTIEDSVNESLKDKNIKVSFTKKSGLTDQLKLYGNDEKNGPDMYMYAHDSLGTFAEMGILSPITDFISTDDEKDLIPMTVEACTYKDTQYQLPLYFETLLFMYNKDLWQGDVPNTTDDLLSYMKKNTDESAGTYAVLNQHSTAYNVAPIINGYGASIITKDGVPGLNTDEYKEAITYNKEFATLQGDGDYNTISELFNEGKAEAIVGGPWLVSGIKEAGINLGIKSLSDFTLPNGKALAPYSGVQGVGVLKYAEENKKDAITEVLKAMADPSVGIALAKESNCAPANQKSYDDSDVASNEMIMAIKETAETAEPMPNIPEMSVMWDPAEKMLAAVNKSGEDVNTAADEYQAAAEKAISDMQ